MPRNFFIPCLSGLALFFFDTPAGAYIDPGTGSFVIQVVIAALVSAAFALKTFWKQVKGFFARLAGKPGQGGNE